MPEQYPTANGRERPKVPRTMAVSISKGKWNRHLRSRQMMIVCLFVVYMLIGIGGYDFALGYDGREYLQYARHIMTNGMFSYDGIHPVVGKPPGFPFVIALYLWMTGSLAGFHWLQLALMFTAFLLIAATTARWSGWTRAMVLLAFLVAAWPLQYLTRYLFSEPLFLALTAAGIYLLVRSLDSDHLHVAALAGVMFGAATYVRQITLLWPLAAVLLVLIWERRRLRLALLALVLHTAIVTPWLYRNWSQFDRFVPMVANWGHLYYMTVPQLWEIYYFQGAGAAHETEEHNRIVQGEHQFNWAPNVRFRQEAIENIRQDFWGYAGRCLRQALFAWTYLPGTKGLYGSADVWFSLGRIGMLLFYVLTFIGARSRYRDPAARPWLYIGFAVYTATVLFPVCTESRYLMAAYLWLLPLALTGAWATGRYLISRNSLRSNGA